MAYVQVASALSAQYIW